MRMEIFGITIGLLFLATLFASGCDDGNKSADDSGAGGDASTDDGDASTDNFECTEDDYWWIWNLSVMPPVDEQICAHVRGTGENVYVLVEKDAWGNSVDQDNVDALIEAWDDSTPADSGKGIFELATGLFGTPPDEFDDDERIYLFLYEMEPFGSAGFDGYFKVDDETNSQVSNHHEMLHINSLLNSPDSDYMLSVQAHEFQHLIHWGADPDEEIWVNESLSEIAMVLTGFGADDEWVDSWLTDPSDPLMENGPGGNYGVFMLFGTYLWERFGDSFIAELVADTDNGVESLDDLLDEQSPGLDLPEILGDMGLAIAVNDSDNGFEGGKYGYNLIDFDEVDSSDLETGTPVTVDVPSSGGFSFISSQEETDGLTLRIETAAFDAVEVRIAFTGANGSLMVSDSVTIASQDFALGTWPTGAVLWISVSNSSSQDVSLDASLF